MFFKKIIKHHPDLEHPDEETMSSIINEGNKLGLSPEKSWQAFLTAGEFKSLSEQEIIDGGSGDVAKRTDPELMRNVLFRENQK